MDGVGRSAGTRQACQDKKGPGWEQDGFETPCSHGVTNPHVVGKIGIGSTGCVQPQLSQEPLKEELSLEEAEPITRKKVVALILGVFCILMATWSCSTWVWIACEVPGLKMGCGLPPC